MSPKPTRARTVAIGSLIALTLGVTATFLWSQRHRGNTPAPSISAIGALPRERAHAGSASYDAKTTPRGRDNLARALVEMNRQAAAHATAVSNVETDEPTATSPALTEKAGPTWSLAAENELKGVFGENDVRAVPGS